MTEMCMRKAHQHYRSSKKVKDTDYVLLCDLQEFVCIEHIWSALIRLTILYKSKWMLRAYSILSHGEKKKKSVTNEMTPKITQMFID